MTRTAQPQDGRPPRLVYTLTLARLGQFSLLTYAERSVVLAARTSAVHTLLNHLWIMHALAEEHGERWGELATAELIRRHEQELAWLAGLGEIRDP